MLELQIYECKGRLTIKRGVIGNSQCVRSCIAAATRIGNVAVVKATGPFPSPTLYVVRVGNVFVSATYSFDAKAQTP